MGYMSELSLAIDEARARGDRFAPVETFAGWRVWDVHKSELVDDDPTDEFQATADAEWLNSPAPLAEDFGMADDYEGWS